MTPPLELLKHGWRQRWLFKQLLLREIKNRYLGSVSAVFWVFIQPLAQLAIYSFVFGVIFKVRFPELGEHGFLVFVALALWPWLAFSEALQRATAVVPNNADLIKKVKLPCELLVIAAVAAPYIIHGIGYLTVLAVLALLGTSLDWWALPALIGLWGIQGAFTLGLGFLLSAFQVFLRDLEFALASLLMLWFYATPILYPRKLVPESMLPLIDANPMSYFVERIRGLWLSQEAQGYGWDMAAIFSSLLFCFLAWRLFRRCATRFEDFL